MASFSSPTFSSARYALARPTYPAHILNAIALFHTPSPLNVALDLGCGTGQLARLLRMDHVDGVPNSLRAARVLAIDPSAGMVEQARGILQKEGVEGVECRTGRAEEISKVTGSEKVDLAIVGEAAVVLQRPTNADATASVHPGQAAHWFDHSKVWAELGKVVRCGGTVAYIVRTLPDLTHPICSTAFAYVHVGIRRINTAGLSADCFHNGRLSARREVAWAMVGAAWSECRS